MWANTCWGFLALAVTFAAAGHSEPAGSAKQIFFIAAAASSVVSAFCFAWPLFKRRRQAGPDMPLASALNYMVNDSSVKLKKPKAAEIEQFGPAKGRLVNWPGIGHQDAVQQVQTATNSGQLSIWGQRELAPGANAMFQFERSLRPIPTTYWEFGCVDLFFCHHVTTTNAQTTTFPGRSTERYTGLMVNRRQVEALWPPGPWWRRRLADVHFIRRKNYWGKPIDRRYRPML
jgi:hypothetical protein